MSSRKKIIIASLISLTGIVGGCRKYNEPIFVEADTNEEVFVIPLEGDVSSQVRFESEKFLAEKQVASKRIQVPRRWVSTGYLWIDGEYIPTVRVIKVDRSPTTRVWTIDNKNAIWAESKDSVGFSMDIVCTAMILSENAPKFLYNYPASNSSNTKSGVNLSSSSLSNFMDSEIRARVQEVFAREVGRYNMDELRAIKSEIMDDVRSEVIPFFDNRGITITTLGLGGGLNYENEAIQLAIDKTFQDQQEKVSAEASRQAQEIKNQTIKLAAEAQAEAERIKAEGQANAIKILVQAGAENNLYYLLQSLQVQQSMITNWDGALPRYNFTDGGTPFMFNMPLDRE